jgi:hypothetical protein
MYNPFSLLNALDKKDFDNYWFETGTPTFLANMLKDIGFDIQRLEDGVYIPADFITKYRAEYADPVPLLYQSGYLTIKDFDARLNQYILCFPNEEVRYGFFNELLPIYMATKEIKTEFYSANFVRDLLENNVESFMNKLRAFFANIPYDLNNKEEKHYQTLFYVFFMLMGQFVEVEHHSSVGRSDAIIKTDTTIFVFEFKLTEKATAEEAIKQIDEKSYLLPFTASNKKLVKIGVEFSAEERGISRWKEG